MKKMTFHSERKGVNSALGFLRVDGTQYQCLLAPELSLPPAGVNYPGLLRLLLKPEHQRLDGDGDGTGGFQDFAEVDEVEVVERDAVDGENVVLDVEVVS